MQTVYTLHHLHILEEDREDVKLCGVYSTRERAESAMTQLKQQPGFRDLPELCTNENNLTEGFYIDRYEVDRVTWNSGFVTE